jgi:hypothetical protein
MANDLYSVGFFELQLAFARRVAELSGMSFAEAVGLYTNIYVRLGMGQWLDPNNVEWQDYVARLAGMDEQAEWTHAIHRSRLHLPAGPAPTEAVGCFSYNVLGQNRVRLHFHAGRCESPLSVGNRDLRRSELDALFARLKASAGDEVHVVGASWLHNLPSYRCLFPEPYLASLRVVEHPYQRMPLWGQFLDRSRAVRPEAGTRFLADIARASNLSELSRSFPFEVLTTTAPARWFYGRPG